MTIPNYWLSQWLDENEIHAEWEIEHALGDSSAIKRFVERVEQAAAEAEQNPPPGRGAIGDAIVAGKKLDLSGTISCSVFPCLKATIDNAFKNV